MDMNYFNSPFAEMCADRIKALLATAGVTNVFAQPCGRVMANIDNHAYLFGLTQDSNLILIQQADIQMDQIDMIIR